MRSHAIEYRRPAFAGDAVTVLTWVANFRKVRSLRKYRIVRPADEAVLAVAQTDWAFVNLSSHRPARVPSELAGDFAIVRDHEAP